MNKNSQTSVCDTSGIRSFNFDRLKVIDYVGLSVLGIACFAYAIWIRRFAELHIRVSFLDFPVFVGEILFFGCFILYLLRAKIESPNLAKRHFIIIVYFIFVIAKALYGYFKWGPLAFRHAALFYYPAFVIFGFRFYRRGYFSNGVNLLISVVILLTLSLLEPDYVHWPLAFFIIGIIVIYACPNKMLRFTLLSWLMYVTPFRKLVDTSRTMMVSHFAASLFFIFCLYLVLKIKQKLRLALIILLVFLMTAVTFRYARKSGFRSLVDIKSVIELVKIRYGILEQMKQDSRATEMSDANINIYNPEAKEQSQVTAVKTPIFETFGKIIARLSNSNARFISEMPKQQGNREERPQEIRASGDKTIPVEEEGSLLLQANQREPGADRTLYEEIGNMTFRLFIWEDMLIAYFRERPILGFDFGRPFRSPSLEAANLASGEWTRDGWIGAHNSYLEIVFRGGVVGILFLMFVFMNFFKVVKFCIQSRLWIGMMLCAIVIEWFVAANFLLILELPYTAIPIWSLCGVILGYCRDKAKLQIV